MKTKQLKKAFKKGFDEYLKTMGREIIVVLKPFSTDCPNCYADKSRNVSANIYNESFKRPVNIFPGTAVQRKIYPAPFNVESVSGVQYDPDLIDPKILNVSICPVCKGEGKLIVQKNISIIGLVTWNPKEELKDLSPGFDGESVCRIKTFEYNYAVIREAEYFLVNNIKCLQAKTGVPRLKGLGEDHIVEFYLQAVKEDKSVSTKFDDDQRLQYNNIGIASDQAPESNPTTPPTVPGDEVW